MGQSISHQRLSGKESHAKGSDSAFGMAFARASWEGFPPGRCHECYSLNAEKSVSMILLPWERLLRIATCQARPGVVIEAEYAPCIAVFSLFSPTGLADGGLAARMVANGLNMALRDEVWQRRQPSAHTQIGEAKGLRLMIWMDSRDDQPGLTVLWDLTREVLPRRTAYGTLILRPVMVIGRNMRSGEHFVMRYVPGDWLRRLEQIGCAAGRSGPAF